MSGLAFIGSLRQRSTNRTSPPASAGAAVSYLATSIGWCCSELSAFGGVRPGSVTSGQKNLAFRFSPAENHEKNLASMFSPAENPQTMSSIGWCCSELSALCFMFGLAL